MDTVKRNPDASVEAYAHLGHGLVEAGEMKHAKAAFSFAQSLDTTHTEALLGSALLLDQKIPFFGEVKGEKRERGKEELCYVLRMYEEVLEGDASNLRGLKGGGIAAFR